MNEILKDRLGIMMNDELLLTALKAVFNERVEKEKPQIGPGVNDNVIGQKYRAYAEAKKIVDGAFNDLLNYKNNKKISSNFNRAK